MGKGSTVSVPEEAVTAAAGYLHDVGCDDGNTKTCGRWRCGSDPASKFHSLHARHVEYYREKATALLEAAVPFIAAAERERVLEEVRASAGTWGGILTDAIRHAERERIRQLAIEHAAVYLTGNVRDGIAHYPFADLLEDTP